MKSELSACALTPLPLARQGEGWGCGGAAPVTGFPGRGNAAMGTIEGVGQVIISLS